MSNKRLHRQASILSTTSSTIPLAQDAGAEAPDGRARASTLLLRYSTDLGPAARAFVLPATDDAPARRERTLAEVERFLASLRQDELRSARASYVSAAAPRPRSKSRARATATATPRGLDANWCAKATPRSSVAPKSARTTMMTFTTEASSIDVPDFTPELFRVYKQARGSSESLVTGPVITAEDEVVYDGPGLFARRAPTPELTDDSAATSVRTSISSAGGFSVRPSHSRQASEENENLKTQIMDEINAAMDALKFDDRSTVFSDDSMSIYSVRSRASSRAYLRKMTSNLSQPPLPPLPPLPQDEQQSKATALSNGEEMYAPEAREPHCPHTPTPRVRCERDHCVSVRTDSMRSPQEPGPYTEDSSRDSTGSHAKSARYASCMSQRRVADGPRDRDMQCPSLLTVSSSESVLPVEDEYDEDEAEYGYYYGDDEETKASPAPTHRRETKDAMRLKIGRAFAKLDGLPDESEVAGLRRLLKLEGKI